MAKLEISGFEDLEKLFLQEDKNAGIAVDRMLNVAADVYVKAQKEEIRRYFESSDRSTGDLGKSIKKSKVTRIAGSASIDVRPTGTDRNGVKNAEKGFVLNFGRSNMPAKPWIDTANEKCNEKAYEAMKKEWESLGND